MTAMIKNKVLIAGTALLVLAFIALPVSAAVCPDLDCPYPDCPENKYQYRGDTQTVTEIQGTAECPDCPYPDCPENQYRYGRA
jgi:hypothetical protein